MALSLFSKTFRLGTTKYGSKWSQKSKGLARAFSSQAETPSVQPIKNQKVADIIDRLRKIEAEVTKQSLLEKDAFDAMVILKPDSPAEVETLGEEHSDKKLTEQYELRLKKKQERILKFRQAILDRHAELGLQVPDDLSPDEIPEGPLHIKGFFGTPERPILVPTDEDNRIVGCQGGGGPKHHDVLWHVVKREKPLACLECGQVYRLVTYSEFIDWAAQQWEEGQDTVQFYIPEH